MEQSPKKRKRALGCVMFALGSLAFFSSMALGKDSPVRWVCVCGAIVLYGAAIVMFTKANAEPREP